MRKKKRTSQFDRVVRVLVTVPAVHALPLLRVGIEPQVLHMAFPDIAMHVAREQRRSGNQRRRAACENGDKRPFVERLFCVKEKNQQDQQHDCGKYNE